MIIILYEEPKVYIHDAFNNTIVIIHYVHNYNYNIHGIEKCLMLWMINSLE